MPASAWKDQTHSSYQMQGEPCLCQTVALRGGIQGDMSARALRTPMVLASSIDRHPYEFGVK